MSDTSTDSDDTSLTDWSLVDNSGYLDESDSLSIASSVELLEDYVEELEDEDEIAAHIQRRSPIGAGPVFVLRLSSRESVKWDHKSEGDATPMTSSITMPASAQASIDSILSPDSRELQENQIYMIYEMASSTDGSSSFELVNGDNSFHADDPYQVEEILTCTDDTSEGQDGRETVDPIETVTIESVGSLDERQKHLQDFMVLIPKTVPKTGDEVKPLTITMLESEVKMESQSEIKTESDTESAAVMETKPRTNAETLTEDITEAHREIRTECVNKTEIGLQTQTTTEAKNNTLNMFINFLNMLSEVIKDWLSFDNQFTDKLAKIILEFLNVASLFIIILLLGINIGLFLGN